MNTRTLFKSWYPRKLAENRYFGCFRVISPLVYMQKFLNFCVLGQPSRYKKRFNTQLIKYFFGFHHFKDIKTELLLTTNEYIQVKCCYCCDYEELK